MAKHTVEQKNIVGNIKGQLLTGAITALILLILWPGASNRYPPHPGDLTYWTFFALFAILPLSLVLLLAPLHARGIKSLTLPDEERARFVIFVQRYSHVSRLLFFWVCFSALPPLILRWFDAPLAFFLAALVALLCGIGSVLELKAYYRAVEVYYDVLPPDLLQEEIEEGQKRQAGWTSIGIAIFLCLNLLYDPRYASNSVEYIPMIVTPVWQEWLMGPIFFIYPLGIVSELLFMLLLRRWVKRLPS